MSLPDKRNTDWHPYRNGQRRVRWRPGYDCRVQCVHEQKGNHGQHCDEASLDLRDGDIGLSGDLFLMARDGVRLHWDFYRHPPINPVLLVVHVGYPFTAEDVRGKPLECDLLLGGKCYCTEPMGLGFDELWKAVELGNLENLVADPHIEQYLLDCEPIWAALAKYLDTRRLEFELARATLPVRCPHCDGTGLLSRAAEPAPLDNVVYHCPDEDDAL